jgi:uncharacterized protein (DUF433 family)
MDVQLVSRDPEIISGSLCFTGTRVAAKNLFDYLEGDLSLKDFPSVSRGRDMTALEAAREQLGVHAATP